MAKSIKHLVLDTGAIIANVNLHQSISTLKELADNYYAPPGVVDEIKTRKAINMWNSLPFDVVLREPCPSSLKQVINASKVSGDYPSLSIVDMNVIALAYELNQEYASKKDTVQLTEEETAEVTEELAKKLAIDEVEVEEEQEDESESDSGSSDSEGWITVDNIDKELKKLNGFEISEDIVVGCLTTDFALQNVLLHMNLKLVSLRGFRIQRLKTYVLRCRACFNTTSIMTKEFCPSCGHKMLHKCAVSVDENGVQQLHINWNKLMNKRGMNYSIPNPKGGKHAVNEKLFEDQRMPQMKMAKVRADPLADGPFSMHDITSRSANLGIRTMTNRSKNGRNRNEAKRGGRRK